MCECEANKGKVKAGKGGVVTWRLGVGHADVVVVHVEVGGVRGGRHLVRKSNIISKSLNVASDNFQLDVLSMKLV